MVGDFQKFCVCDADLLEIEFIEGSLPDKHSIDCRKRWIDLVSRLAGLGERLIRWGGQNEHFGLDEHWKLNEHLTGKIHEGEQSNS